ncbi:ABC transporter permease subunit [Caldilinea sp.]|uniref:ABC transporter permease n=1 Tax=Caldilinea sp. TaxID=2293560 RepID=UPI002B5EC85A|nr:ABC transporter permease subunit [Anaerolineales bacterium]HQY93620.1 ABC transporter permease subunit [Caldilinea sp.]
MATTLPATPRRRLTWTWLGLAPFFLFAIFFIFLPSASLFIDSFRTVEGEFTLANIAGLFAPPIPESYWLSIRISAFTALGGGLLGFMMAYALTMGNLPRWLRPFTLTFAGVASNFAGVPLAFAFISTLGRTGFVTVFLRSVLGIDVYDAGFNLYSFLGLSLTYMYFQFPLMLLIMVPAIEGLRREWREAAENLGASTWQFWWRVGLPILMPSLLGTILLLFGNAFGAYATAYALTGGQLNIITIEIGAQMRGDVLRNPNLGYAMALGMVAIMAVCITGYTWLQRISERWLK